MAESGKKLEKFTKKKIAKMLLWNLARQDSKAPFK